MLLWKRRASIGNFPLTRRREQPINKNENNMAPPLTVEAIAGRILLLRGRRVMLDADLAALYGISTGRFNEAVRRNLARFPGDLMFPLTNQDLAALRSQIAILKEAGRGQHRKFFFDFLLRHPDGFPRRVLLQSRSGA